MSRPYELMVFGATGYTGKYTAEYITEYAPTDLKWAIAGRSHTKLQAIAEELKALNPNRKLPAIETAELKKDELLKLARKTKVLVSTVGPYHKYGAAVVEACAESGTHYADVTGEVPWVRDMIRKYDATAKKTGAIIIPQNGIESAPADILAYLLALHNRRVLDASTGEVVVSLHDIRGAASGGTLATILSIFDSYSPLDLHSALKPGSLVSRPIPTQPKKPLAELLTGVRAVSGLGTLTDSIQGASDTTIVYRSWSLIEDGKFYGPKFAFSAYMRTRNNIRGAAFHVVLAVATLMLLLPPVRWLLGHFVFQPGQGTEKEEAKKQRIEWRAISDVDTTDSTTPKRSFAKLRWDGSLYGFTGVLLAEAGITLARDETIAHKLGGGLVTPATLGEPYVNRLQKAGVQIDVQTLP